MKVDMKLFSFMGPTLNKIILIIFASVMFVACAPAGGIRPTMFSIPPSYLSNFPLDTVSPDEMILKSGPPDNVIKINGNDALVYRFGELDGVRSYTFISSNGFVSDVIYNDNGSYNGSTAKQYQSKKIQPQSE